MTKTTDTPLVWKLFALCGFLYFLLGLVTFFYEAPGTSITHLPAWFRRTVDGLFVFFVAIFAINHKNQLPWRGWLNHSGFLWYALISVIIHYGGMLPPFYIYDRLPFFNKILHANASVVLLYLIVYARDRSKPSLSEYIVVFFIGLAWEILEYLTTPASVNYWSVVDVGFGWYDTKGDILANITGLLVVWVGEFFRFDENKRLDVKVYQ